MMFHVGHAQESHLHLMTCEADCGTHLSSTLILATTIRFQISKNFELLGSKVSKYFTKAITP